MSAILAQGCSETKGTNTTKFMYMDEIRHIPEDRTVTYEIIVCDHWSQKYDPKKVKITVGGNIIYYQRRLPLEMQNSSLQKNCGTEKIHPGGKSTCLCKYIFFKPLDNY